MSVVFMRAWMGAGAYVSQHVLETLGLPPLAVCAIFAGVFIFFLPEVQEELVVCDEC